jgi:hypothetical protein
METTGWEVIYEVAVGIAVDDEAPGPTDERSSEWRD